MLQLYMEDVYEVDNEPYFGYLRGKYSKEELKDIVAYCDGIGIEVVPCIQTLAHLENALRWKPYRDIVDCENILLVGDEKTYNFIENTFKSLRECFTTEHIHIGMDEAGMLGLGKYLALHGYENRVEILRKHLDRVIEICKKYGFKPMMWSDMFFRLANNGQYYPENPTLPEEVVKTIPKDLGIVYWDYCTADKEYYEKMIRAHKNAGENVWFAGGAWTWAGFASGNKLAIETMSLAMQVASEYGLDMSADLHVVSCSGLDKTVTINTDKKVVRAKWLDNGQRIKVKKNTFAIQPFAYGNSGVVRVLKFELV